IQFHTIPTDEQRAVLAGQGIRLLEYLPKRAYVASLPQGFDRQQLVAANVRSVVSPDRDFKLHPLLEGQQLPAWALKEKGQIDLNVNMYTDLDPNGVIPRLKARGYEVLKRHDHSHYVELRVPIASLDDVVDLPYISFVEPIAEPGEPENYTARTQHRSNIINADHANGMHYDGSGVAVMMQDDGDIGPHIDYTGRIGQFTDGNNGDHGDHVGGTIFGAGNLNPTTRGMATGADLYVYWAAQQGYPGFDSIPSHYNSLGIRITSTSYSDGCNAGYTNRARTMDIQTNSFSSLLHVFSAGNNGFSDCSYGAGAGWGNVTGGHKVGKNVITVANLDLNDNISGSSSRGPAHDGRIKPDVSAKGSSVFSTSDPNTYVFKSGTSMSCPGTSGTMAQLYHAYRDINAGTDPDGGLMKAIMLNTCEDLGNEGPDFTFGWGRINALRAVETIQNQTYMTGTVSQGGSNTHTINVPNGAKQLRVMVYWTDPQASVNASTALVNNLDMTLTDPASNTTLPWLLDFTPTVASLSAPATHGVDSVNNMEQVVIDDPAMGAFTVTVNGTGVPQGPQDYWVVYELITDRITLTYPIGGEPFVPGEVEKIRWDALGDSGTFALEYSLDNGVSWTMINNAVSGSVRFLNWTVPQALTGEAMVRITRGANTDDSDAAFSIIGVPNTVSIDFGCPDSFRVSWTPVTGATAYEVSMLGAKYMDSIGVSTTTSFIVTGVNPLTEYWVAVKALGPQNAIGRRTVAIRKLPGTFNCPLTDDIELTLISSPLNQGFQSCHGDSTD
ncbi:MAG: S8 family serine peptidase, partial [Bacteroidota bacterium]